MGTKSSTSTRVKKNEDLTPRFQVQFDISTKPKLKINEAGEKITVPEASLTVRQLLSNYTRHGDPGAKMKEPLYFDTEIPVFEDLTDIISYRRFLQAQLEKAETWIKNQQDESEQQQEQTSTESSEVSV